MPGFGGFNSFPRRFGGRVSRHKILTQSLVDGLGDGVAASDVNSIQYAECYAEARGINTIWSQNARLANQMDPRRMTDMLPRWERILSIPEAGIGTDIERRLRVLERFTRLAFEATRVNLLDYLRAKLGVVFIDIEYTPIALASIYPAVSGAGWSSTVAHILVRLQIVGGHTLGSILERVALVAPFLDSVLPAWVTWDWYIGPSVGAPVSITDGPSAAGFYLDEPNLDLEILDT